MEADTAEVTEATGTNRDTAATEDTLLTAAATPPTARTHLRTAAATPPTATPPPPTLRTPRRPTEEREAIRQQRRDPSDHMIGGVDDDDLISRLNDDVLVHILCFPPTLTDVLRACTVSRRWCRLQNRVPVIRFVCVDPGLSEHEKLDRFITFVNNILDRRADHHSDADAIEELEISLLSFHTGDCMHDGKYMQCHVSTPLKLMTGFGMDNKIVLDEILPSSARLETMVLSLSNACFRRLPFVAAFDSLTNLSLENMQLEDDSVHLLNRLLSPSCCPHLQKLCLHNLTVGQVVDQLHFESSELLELSLHIICQNFCLLEIITPGLRVFHMRSMSVERLSISAPRLEEITLSTILPSMINVKDMPCVRKIELMSPPGFVYSRNENQADIRLLQCCRLLQFLTLHLCIYKKNSHEDEEVDLMKDIPQLPHVLSLSLNVSAPNKLYDIAPNIAYLLTRCKFLEHFELKMIYNCPTTNLRRSTNVGNQNQRDYQTILLEHLQEIKIIIYYMGDYESTLIKFFHASAPHLKKMRVAVKSPLMDSQSLRTHSKICEELLNSIALGKEGKWVFCNSDVHMQNFIMFEWAPIKSIKDYNECRGDVD
uniref:F-box domain-containing protein n=1 Tax=Leersia perrieri TaxID=77586 RepID=A0A0D9UWY4_9ORYZ